MGTLWTIICQWIGQPRRNRQVSGNIFAAQSVCLMLCDSMDYTLAHQASLSTLSQSLLKFMSIESVRTSNHLIVCCLLFLLPSIFASIRVFSSESAASGGQSIGASASASELPMNIQGWFPLGLTGLISLLSKGLSRVFSCTTVQKHQFFGAQQPDMCTPSTLISHDIQAAHQGEPWTWAALLSLL